MQQNEMVMNILSLPCCIVKMTINLIYIKIGFLFKKFQIVQNCYRWFISSHNNM